jgi:ABC-type branched-subunit amino acid transport system ATPase component
MDRPHIETIHILNYGCIRDVKIKLTPLHALIGPNDSGKSTVLMALRTSTTIAAGNLRHAGDDFHKLRSAIQLNPEFLFRVAFGGDTWGLRPLKVEGAGDAGDAFLISEALMGQSTRFSLDNGSELARRDPNLKASVAGSLLLRLEPDALRQPTSLIQDGAPVRFMNSLGLGLPAIYDAIITRDLPAYMAINAELRRLFPAVKSLSLKNQTNATKALGIQLTSGAVVSADFMSEGMLYYLAYAALAHLEPTAVILVEEPENGLHPARIRDVMAVLREISKGTQVIVATHSPLVINELEPDEVTVLTRKPEEGTVAVPIHETPNFVERASVYALGELWVSYADGKYEEPLFKDPEPPPDPGEPLEWTETDDR